MKVAMLGWEFPPFLAGGLGIHCLELTKGLHREGVQIDFYMPHMETIEGPTQVATQHDHLKIHEVEADPGVSPYGPRRSRYKDNFNDAVRLYNQRLVTAFQSGDADVLHCHDWITVPAALELRRKTGLPLVFTVHSLEIDRSAGFFPQTWIEDIEKHGAQGADAVITVSNYTKTLVVERYGVDPAKVHPVHNGVSAARPHPNGRRDYDRAAPTVLFLSRVSRQKGPLFFMKAAKRVLSVRGDVRFVMVGKGEMLPECIEYAVQNGIADRVRFEGFLPAREQAAAYEQSDVYVLPSVSEPFGISILEAMSNGLPTIVSKTTGVGEALAHVLKVDFWDTDEMADLILAVLDSPVLRQELGTNGARESHRFTWARTARETLGVYQRLVDQRTKGLVVAA